MHVDLSGILLFSSWSHFGVRHSGMYMYASSELYALCYVYYMYVVTFLCLLCREEEEGTRGDYSGIQRCTEG